MDVIQLQRRFIDYTSSLYQEGFLDEQFMQLQQLQDESNPEFVVEVVSLFFEDAEKLLVDLSKTLAQQPVEFKKVDAHVHQFKGSSSSSMGVSENFKFILLNDGNQSDQTLQRGVSTVAWDAIF